MDVEDVGGIDDEVRPAAQAGLGQRRVDGAGGQDRRDRQPVEDEARRRRARGPRPRPRRRRTAVGGEPLEGGLEAGRAVGRRPRRVEPPDPLAAVAQRVEQAVEVGDDRPVEAQRPRAARRAAEQRRPPAELDPQVHHDPLALGVDRRVRDLGERLAEVVGDRPVEAAAAGRRRVVAHAPERLVALERHRLDVEPGALGVEAGEVAQRRRAATDSWARAAAAASGRSSWIGRGGVVDGQRPERAGLRLGVLEDRPPARLDQQQLARAEAAAPDRVGGLERDGSRPRTPPRPAGRA